MSLAGRLKASTAAQPVARPVEGDQLALARPSRSTTTTSSSGPGSPITWILVVVLVGPEERDRVVGHGGGRAGQQVAGRGGPALGGVGPVLDPEPARPVEGRIQSATSPAATTRSAANSVPSQATPLSRVSPEPSSQPTDGDHPDAHHHHVGGQARCRRPGQTVTGSAAAGVGLQAVDARRRHRRSIPLATCRSAQASPISSPSTRASGVWYASSTVTRGPEALAGGGHLGADEAGADDHHPGSVARAGQLGPDAQAVVEGAQHPHAGHALGAGQGAGGGPGGDDQPVVGELAAVVEVDGAGRRCRGRRPGARAGTRDRGRRGRRACGGGSARRPICPTGPAWTAAAGRRGRGLVADDDDRAGVALVADLLGGPQAGQRGADHDDGRVAGTRDRSWGES